MSSVLFTTSGTVVVSRGAGRVGGQIRQARPGDRFWKSGPIIYRFHALPELGRTAAHTLENKTMLNTSNPFPQRDGEMAENVRQSGRGMGPYLREWFPGIRIVRAFNTGWDRTLAAGAYRAEPGIGIPLASDDAVTLRVAAELVVDAGFDPVIVESLDHSCKFDLSAAVYNTGMSGPQVLEALEFPDRSGL